MADMGLDIKAFFDAPAEGPHGGAARDLRNFRARPRAPQGFASPPR
jgi:hypothetical protein